MRCIPLRSFSNSQFSPARNDTITKRRDAAGCRRGDHSASSMVSRRTPAMKLIVLLAVFAIGSVCPAEDWPQFMLNSQHSGNAADREISAGPLGVLGQIVMTDGIYTSP